MTFWLLFQNSCVKIGKYSLTIVLVGCGIQDYALFFGGGGGGGGRGERKGKSVEKFGAK